MYVYIDFIVATLWGIAVAAPFCFFFLPGRGCSQVSLSMASGENLHMTLSGICVRGVKRGRGEKWWLGCVYLVLFCAHTHTPQPFVLFLVNCIIVLVLPA